MEVALTLLTAWFGTGVAVAAVMGRRGHGFGDWLRAGLVAGPFSVGLAVEALGRHDRERPRGVERHGGTGCAGTSGAAGCRRGGRRPRGPAGAGSRPRLGTASRTARRRHRSRPHRRRPHGLHGQGG